MELRRALSRCGGQIGAAVIVAVVCDRESVVSWSAKMQWPREHGMGALKVALEAAADDLGLDRLRR